jgi:hypothetical protein
VFTTNFNRTSFAIYLFSVLSFFVGEISELCTCRCMCWLPDVFLQASLARATELALGSALGSASPSPKYREPGTEDVPAE